MLRSIMWFRNDLRLHDNEALSDAISHNEEVLPAIYQSMEAHFATKNI